MLLPLPTTRTASTGPHLDSDIVHCSQAKSLAAGVEQIAMPDQKDGFSAI